MRKIKYSKDVDILLIELSDKPIDYAEEEGRIIIHFSKDGEPVLIEILDAKEFVLSSIASVIQEKEVALSLWGNKCLMSKLSLILLMSVLKRYTNQTLNLSKNTMLIHLIKTSKFQRVPFGNNLMWYMISTLLPIKEKLRRTDWLIDK